VVLQKQARALWTGHHIALGQGLLGAAATELKGC
jgi:hypothetical protein